MIIACYICYYYMYVLISLRVERILLLLVVVVVAWSESQQTNTTWFSVRMEICQLVFQVTLIFCIFLISFQLLSSNISNTQDMLSLSFSFSTWYFYCVITRKSIEIEVCYVVIQAKVCTILLWVAPSFHS